MRIQILDIKHQKNMPEWPERGHELVSIHWDSGLSPIYTDACIAGRLNIVILAPIIGSSPTGLGIDPTCTRGNKVSIKILQRVNKGRTNEALVLGRESGADGVRYNFCWIYTSQCCVQ